MSIFESFSKLVDPSTTLGAFIISIAATFLGGFFTGKKVGHIQKAKHVGGDMMTYPRIA